MPQVEVEVGGRSFEVACQPGEEPYLRAAAAILDTEASSLSSQIGRMPEARMLLMSGLMLADKASGLEEKVRESEARATELEARATELEARIAELEARGAVVQTVEVPVEVPVEVRVEVPMVPEDVTRIMSELAEEAEALARAVLAVAPDRETIIA